MLCVSLCERAQRKAAGEVAVREVVSTSRPPLLARPRPGSWPAPIELGPAGNESEKSAKIGRLSLGRPRNGRNGSWEVNLFISEQRQRWWRRCAITAGRASERENIIRFLQRAFCLSVVVVGKFATLEREKSHVNERRSRGATCCSLAARDARPAPQQQRQRSASASRSSECSNSLRPLVALRRAPATREDS